MQRLTVYSSAPLGIKLVCVFQNLKLAGLEIVRQPLSALPTSAVPPRRGRFLRDELAAVTQSLVSIGQQLDEHETQKCVLEAGLEQGLRFERDVLQTRQRAIRATLKVQQGGPPMGAGPN